jgi:hypothetical protein
MGAATATILLPGRAVAVTGEAEKFYDTNFQAEVTALGGRPYYTPLDLGG